MLIQTVATVRYLHFVAVMINSIRAHSKNVKFSVLVSDVSPRNLQQVREKFDSDIEFLCCDDLGVEYLSKMREYYNVLEFCSACKILAISYQLNKKNHPECLFLDPDMYAVGDILNIFKLCDRDILITPHSTSPYPDDNKEPTDVDLAVSGHINGGIVYFRKSPPSMAALDWLTKQIKHNWFVAPRYGFYADQQWLSFLPYYFYRATVVSKNLTLNIAYWNLHERKLSEVQEKIIVNNSLPVLLFHFSGFTIPSDGRLTQHSSRRFEIETENVLRKLIAEYENKLFEKQKIFFDLKGDIEFCNDPLEARMIRAEKIWGHKYRFFQPSTTIGFFRVCAKKIDRLFNNV
jgi:hypothetical protein